MGCGPANKEFDNAIALEPGFSQAYFAAADLYDHIILADDRPDAESARCATAGFALSRTLCR